MQRFFDHIFAYYDFPLPIGSDEIITRLQMWLNNPQRGHIDIEVTIISFVMKEVVWRSQDWPKGPDTSVPS